MKETERKIMQMFNALGDASRFNIFKILLNKKDICVSEIADSLGITVSAVSQHLKILELSGLVTKHRNGQMICYEIMRTDSFVKCVIKLFK